MSAAQEIGAAVREFSSLQCAIFAHRADPANASRNLVVEALAGTGKSTTIEELVMRLPAARTVGVFAFNKAIAAEMKARIDDPLIDVATWHSFGFRMLREAELGVRIEDRQAYQLVSKVLGPGDRKAKGFVLKLLSLAKGSLCEASVDALQTLAEAYDLWPPKGKLPADKLFQITASLLRQQAARGRKVIDFDDMIWLPIIWGIQLKQYDDVVVDEAQDLNPAQLELALRTAASGRLTAVGDRHQSIYQFRGADSQAIPRIIAATNADLLPLSITYRCARAIVAEAQEFVPAIEAAPWAVDGRVSHVTEDFMYEEALAGDFVVSRLNAPLVKLAYQWLRAGVPCEIKGRSIGADLVEFIESLKADSLEELERKAGNWLSAVMADESRSDRSKEAAADRVECLTVLAREAKSVAEITTKLEEMFGDAEGDPSTLITLSSTHKAKGLESERVWLLRDTYRPGESQEETNLLYVAITRAKKELIYVSSEPA